MSTVEIEYCHPYGFLDRTEAVRHALLSNLVEKIDELTSSLATTASSR